MIKTMQRNYFQVIFNDMICFCFILSWFLLQSGPDSRISEGQGGWGGKKPGRMDHMFLRDNLGFILQVQNPKLP